MQKERKNLSTSRAFQACIETLLNNIGYKMSSIIKQVMNLQDKSTKELKDIYKSIFGESAPFYASGVHLVPKIAYKLQELSMGGLSKSTENKLLKISKGEDPQNLNSNTPLPGCKIRKKYKDVIHEVEVKKKGFEYMGQHFGSLSAVATKITGTKWNGPKFFGLR